MLDRYKAPEKVFFSSHCIYKRNVDIYRSAVYSCIMSRWTSKPGHNWTHWKLSCVASQTATSDCAKFCMLWFCVVSVISFKKHFLLLLFMISLIKDPFIRFSNFLWTFLETYLSFVLCSKQRWLQDGSVTLNLTLYVLFLLSMIIFRAKKNNLNYYVIHRKIILFTFTICHYIMTLYETWNKK